MTRTHTCTLARSLALLALAGVLAIDSTAQTPPASAASTPSTPSTPSTSNGSIDGVVRDAEGKALADVPVRALPFGMEPELLLVLPTTRTDSQGRFHFDVESNLYSVSALPRGDLDVVVAPPVIVAPERTAQVELECRPDSLPLEFTGRVERADGTRAPKALVVLQRREDGALLAPELDAEGRFHCRAPRGTWRALARESGARSEWVDRHGPDEHALVLAPAAEVLAAAPPEAARELRERLVAAKDLGVEAVAAAVGDARVVALGDVLRGTHEELALVGGLFRRLVEQRGFRLLAIDAPFGDVWKIDDWLRTGTGDPRALLQAVPWGDWQSEELLELLVWMRAWNSDEAHATKVGVVGLDPLHPTAAAAILQEYFPKVDAIMGLRFSHWISPFRQVNDLGLPRYEALEADARLSLKLSIQDLHEMYPDVKENYLEHSTEAEYQTARWHLNTIKQCEEILRLRSEGWTTRDRERHMGTNLRDALERSGEGAKALVVARNSLTGISGAAEFGSLGWWLQDAYAGQMVSVGVLVGGGSARVPDATSDMAPRPKAAIVNVPPPSEGTLEALFAATGKDAGVLDLRTLRTDGAARRWLSVERARRSLDEAWYGGLASLRRAVPLEELHVAVWIGSVSPVRALEMQKH